MPSQAQSDQTQVRFLHAVSGAGPASLLVEKGLVEFSAGQAVMPVRVTTQVPAHSGIVLGMPAFLGATNALGTNPAYKDYADMSPREVAIAAPLVVLSVALGVLPGTLLLSWMEPSVTGLVDTLAKLGGR